ncbi:LysM peptidoglycan-binding domain-containing protein [Luteimonas sp. BDR2-5]|uniref:LysM peptidoglycan-binding domain-containing protein n=1 Tax=Proluteimonas luteida TaxID=2878685 RepID=UPI001E37CC64|nr:LysM domain-containing protein [Luteimonas sp. BDR2-5]MCD9027483.1 LysM peptidoglycan-binding domain-containing protein [Luteimonas sp. BDR2-5]
MNMNVCMHDGGGAIRQPAQPEPTLQPTQHRAVVGDTVASLAERYMVSPEAIHAANPRLAGTPAQGGGNPVQPGDVIQIPASPMSASGDVDGGSANHSTTDVKVTLKDDNGSITWQPDSLAVKLTDKQKVELGNSRADDAPGNSRGASISVSSESSVQLQETQGDGTTSFTVTADTRVGFSAEANAGGRGGAEIEVGAATGFESRYKVTLPGEGRPVEAASGINPFDPTTIPVGGSVTLDSSAYTNTSLAGSFRMIGTETHIKASEGVSYTVERVDEDTVRVTTGPTETINAFNGVGLRAGDISVMAGREDQLHGATLQTAEFDISTAEGQAAYAHFNSTGQIAHETPGVDNVATVSRIDYSSQTQLRAGTDELAVVLGGQANLGSAVQVTYPDGSYSLTTDLTYGANVPLTISQRFDADGNELPGERSYQFEVDTDRPGYNWFERNILGKNEASEEQANADLLNWALTGGQGSGPVQAGDKVTLTFSEAQLQSLMEQTRATVDGNEFGGAHSDLRVMVEDYNGNPLDGTMDFAVSLARNLNNDPYGFASKLHTISSGADGDIANQSYARIDADVQTH